MELQQEKRLALDEALERNHHFNIGDAVSQGFSLTKGYKGTIFLALLVLIGVAFVLGIISGITSSIFGDIIGTVIEIVTNAIMIIVSAGWVVLGLNRIRDKEVRIEQVFSGFERAGTIIGVYFLTVALVFVLALVTIIPVIFIFQSETGLMVGIVILAIAFCYISVALSFTQWIIMDHREVGAFKAIQSSFAIVNKNFFKLFVFFLVISLINIVAVLLLLVGLIWTIPASLFAMAYIYESIFKSEGYQLA